MVLTHFISVAEKTPPVRSMRNGMVRMITKGRAREKGLIFTAHSTAKHTSWIKVNMCIRKVFTCNTVGVGGEGGGKKHLLKD